MRRWRVTMRLAPGGLAISVKPDRLRSVPRTTEPSSTSRPAHLERPAAGRRRARAKVACVAVDAALPFNPEELFRGTPSTVEVSRFHGSQSLPGCGCARAPRAIVRGRVGTFFVNNGRGIARRRPPRSRSPWPPSLSPRRRPLPGPGDGHRRPRGGGGGGVGWTDLVQHPPRRQSARHDLQIFTCSRTPSGSSLPGSRRLGGGSAPRPPARSLLAHRNGLQEARTSTLPRAKSGRNHRLSMPLQRAEHLEARLGAVHTAAPRCRRAISA